MQHDWIPSTLGHGETMCRRCFVTNREAAVLGIANECDVPPPEPKAANKNTQSIREWTQDEIDEDMFRDDDDEDGDDGWSECGRWDNGRLSQQCRKAGSEECDWDCPIMLPTRQGLKRSRRV